MCCTTIGSIWFGLWKWKASHNQMHLSIPSSYPNKQLTHKQHYNCCTLTTMSHTNTILLRTSWTFKWDCCFCCMEKRIETRENTHLRRWTTHLRRKIDCSLGAVCERRLALRQFTVLNDIHGLRYKLHMCRRFCTMPIKHSAQCTLRYKLLLMAFRYNGKNRVI